MFLGNEIIEFCGNLNFTCFHPDNTRRHHDVLSQILTRKNRENDISPYFYDFKEYSTLAKDDYDISGSIHKLRIAELSSSILAAYSENATRMDGWKIGIADGIENCANFPFEREIGLNFSHTETIRLDFTDETKKIVDKLKRFEISGGGAVWAPLQSISASLAFSVATAWNNR